MPCWEHELQYVHFSEKHTIVSNSGNGSDHKLVIATTIVSERAIFKNVCVPATQYMRPPSVACMEAYVNNTCCSPAQWCPWTFIPARTDLTYIWTPLVCIKRLA